MSAMRLRTLEPVAVLEIPTVGGYLTFYECEQNTFHRGDPNNDGTLDLSEG